MKKTCLVVYVGNGYSEFELSHDGAYTYSTDMKENYENHQENIFNPLREDGYDVEFALLTNKHDKYAEYFRFYNAIFLDYDEVTQHDEDVMKNYYFWRYNVPPGNFRSGGRFKKLKNKIPEYDLYAIIRTDTFFIKSLKDMTVDYDKINWLWPETDWQMFTEFKEAYLSDGKTEFWPWQKHNRVNGNVFNIIPKKFFRMFTNYIWMEHAALYAMLNELSPLVTLDDVNMMLGMDKCYCTDIRYCQNPVYTFNKKIIKNRSDAKLEHFGKK